MMKKILLMGLFLLLGSCTLSPEPMSINDRYSEAKNDVFHLFAHNNVAYKHLDYYHALALGLKHNLDYRIKLANDALQQDQLVLAEFAMFPALNASGSVYGRDNNLASFGTTSTGQITDVLNSTPRTLRSIRAGLSWNILDFGASYVKAKQQGDRFLIAEEEARKQLQQLAQDITASYWEAYSAQELMDETRNFQALLNNSNAKLTMAMRDQSLPKESLLHFQESLLDGDRHLIQLKNKYDKAMFDLKHLLNLPVGWHITLDAPPAAMMKIQNLDHLDFRKLDAISLVTRPELRGQSYQSHIAKMGIQAAILQSLPGITFNLGWNYNSNKFLVNTAWRDRSLDVAWNLLNLASLPTALDSAEAQIQYEKLKRMALTLTVLTETRYSYSRYQNLVSEYRVAHRQTVNAQQLYKLVQDRNRASLASDQQAVVAKLHSITAKMDEDLLLSDLSTALGELYLSSGFDILPYNLRNEKVTVIADRIRENFAQKKTLDFNAYVDNTYYRLFNPNHMPVKKRM